MLFYLYLMNKIRCQWSESDPLYTAYHDFEWGVPVFNDQLLFEFLTLETFQAGLNWIIVLRKRDNFKKAFDNFDYKKIAEYDVRKVKKLLANPDIIRNNTKIIATINNAKAYIKVQNEEGSFANYIWGFVSGIQIVNYYKDLDEIPPYTPLAERICKDLKDKGFKFLGATTIYSYMQAIGLVNDHIVSCFRHSEVNLKR